MTNNSTVQATAPSTADIASATASVTASRKSLKVSSETHKKPEKGSVAATARKGAGASALSGEPTVGASNETAAEQPRPTKASVVEALMTREGGASLEALCEATGWQAHTCRAFLTGLRKKGREVIRASDRDGKSIYLIAPDRLPAVSPDAGQTEAERN